MMDNMKRWHWWLAWIFIFIIGIGLRFWQLGQIPWGTYWDETAILVDAQALASTGRDIHGLPLFQTIFPSYGDYKLPAYIWLASLSVKIFGATAWAVRLPSALVGVATIGLAGLLGAELLRKRAENSERKLLAVIAGFIVAVSPWSILFSRTAFEGHVGQFFLGLSVYFWLKGKQTKSWLILSGLAGAAAVYCYYSVRFVWPVVILALTLTELWPNVFTIKTIWQSSKHALFLLLVPGVIFYLSLLPLTHSPLASEADRFRLSASSILTMKDWAVVSNQYRAMAGNQFWDRIFYHRHWLMARELLQNYADHLNLNYLFFTGDSNLRHGTGKTGVFLWWCLPGLLVGLYWWAKNLPRYFWLLLVWWLAALLPASVPETTPHALRSLNALLPSALFISAGFLALHTWWWNQTKKLNRQLGLLVKISSGLVVAAILITSIFSFGDDYFNFYPTRSAAAWQTGYTQLAKKIVSINSTGAQTWIVQDDARFFLWMLLKLDIKNQQPSPWIEKDYQFSQLGPYHFIADGDKVVVNDQPMLLITKTSQFEQISALHHLQPSWVEEFQPYDFLPGYTLAGFAIPAPQP
jgi:4-amino-4-deoxy-L-arabinose transferase-like glycosyltransferase